MKLIDKLSEMQHVFSSIYKEQNSGLISISNECILLQTSSFLKNFKDFDILKFNEEYPIELSRRYNAVSFVAILNFGELENLKEKYPVACEKIKEEWGKLSD